MEVQHREEMAEMGRRKPEMPENKQEMDEKIRETTEGITKVREESSQISRKGNPPAGNPQLPVLRRVLEVL